VIGPNLCKRAYSFPLSGPMQYSIAAAFFQNANKKKIESEKTIGIG